MKTKQMQINDHSITVDWHQPLPVWSTLAAKTKAFVRIFTIQNQGNFPVTISAVNLIPGGDERIKITDGTCVVGSMLAARSSCTIEITVNPLYAGKVEQVLRVQHTGFGPPLWADIIFSIAERTRHKPTGSYLVNETWTMDRQRRLSEQAGHRRLARVHARTHAEPTTQAGPAPEGELQNDILQNPWLNSQRFDGVDPNLNPEPPLNTEARREFDNERREQEMEKQLRLGNMPKFSTAPKPHGP